MIDPEDVTSGELIALDRLIDFNRDLHAYLTGQRRKEFTRTYDRLRKARIQQIAPVRNPLDAA